VRSRSAPKTVTVQPGDTLWVIAELTLGNGARWPEIYRVNRNKIRNPRRIHPGQVLVVPR
jgi:nucleoid-associated protein YgaU